MQPDGLVDTERRWVVRPIVKRKSGGREEDEGRPPSATTSAKEPSELAATSWMNVRRVCTMLELWLEHDRAMHQEEKEKSASGGGSESGAIVTLSRCAVQITSDMAYSCLKTCHWRTAGLKIFPAATRVDDESAARLYVGGKGAGSGEECRAGWCFQYSLWYFVKLLVIP